MKLEHLTVKQLLRMEVPLRNLSRMPYSLGIAYKIGVVRGIIEPYLEQFHEQRSRLVRELGLPIKDEKGEPTAQLTVPTERISEFEDRLKSTLDTVIQELNIPVAKIKLSQLRDDAREQAGVLKLEPNQFVLTGGDLASLDWLVENDLGE